MALDYTGIENVEFYSEHYLSAVLERDLKSVFQKWKVEKEENGTRPPNESLASMANRYFKVYAKAAGESDPVERLMLAQDVHAHLLEALGYSRDPGVEAERRPIRASHLAQQFAGLVPVDSLSPIRSFEADRLGLVFARQNRRGDEHRLRVAHSVGGDG